MNLFASCRQSVIGSKKNPARAFTLVELLIVMAIVAMLLALVGTSFRSTMKTQTLSSMATRLGNDLSFAAQWAAKENRPLEVRFYQFEDKLNPGVSLADSPFKGYQFLYTDPTTGKKTPIQDMSKMEGNVIIIGNKTTVHPKPEEFTTICNTANGGIKTFTAATDPDVGLGDYKYFGFSIRPDGSTTLGRTGKWSVTMVNDPPKGATADLPALDYRTVVINPFTTAVKIY